MMIVACAMGMSASEELTLADGSTTNSHVPFNGLWADTEGTISQVFYHADSLQSIPVGSTITGIKFYASGNGISFSRAYYQLSLGEVDANPFQTSSGPAATGLTIVSSDVVIPAGTLEVILEFDAPYTYMGGNLVFESLVTTGGSYGTTNFYGMSVPSDQDYTCFSRSTAERFIPKTTFIYDIGDVDDAASVSPKSLDFGKMIPNTEKELIVTLRNIGKNPFTPSVSALTSPFSTTYEAAELAAGSSVEIPVVFAPTDEGTFTANMTIDCGEAGVFEIPLNGLASNELELVVSDGTISSTNYPYKGTYTDTQGTVAQMIYPAQMLADVAGANITAIKFHAVNNLPDLQGATLQISLAETDQNAFERETATSAPTNLIPDEAFKPVAEVVRVAGDKVWEIPFDEPYAYTGKNLVVKTLVSVAGAYYSTSFYGTNQVDLVSYAAWSSNLDVSNFLPKMTVLYKASEDPAVAVERIATDASVTRVRYVNIMGQVCDKPFKGMNIIITDYADGTHTSTKALF